MSTHDPEAGSASAGDGDPRFHHNPARKKRTQTLAFASLLVFVATLQMLVYHMHHVRHHVGVFRRSARERERVVLPRDDDDAGDSEDDGNGEGAGRGHAMPSYVTDGWTRVDVTDELGGRQICRTDERWLSGRRSRSTSFRRGARS